MNLIGSYRCLKFVMNEYSMKYMYRMNIRKKSDFDNYCLNLVKSMDYDRYLVGLLLPRRYQGPYFAIRAFNIEIATIQDNVRGNVLAGQIRFQYWQQILDQIFPIDKTKSIKLTELNNQQPVIRALAYYSQRHGWSSALFFRYIEARYRHLHNGSYESLNELEDLTEFTHSSLLYLLLESYDIRSDIMDQMTSHIGVGTGITTFIKSLAYPQSHEFKSFPRELILKYGLTTDILQGRISTENDLRKLKDAVYDVASQAAGHIDRAKKLQDKCKGEISSCNAISLEAASTVVYLEELRKEDFNIFSPRLTPERLRFQQTLQLLRTRLFRVI